VLLGARVPRAGGGHGDRAARLRADGAREREGGAGLPDDGAGRVRVRRCAARAVARRVGDLGGREAARGVDAYLMGETFLPASPEL
jgi:hypothetical protein